MSDDIEKLKRELRNEKRCLENIIKNIPGSVYWKDTNGAYLGCNNYVVNMADISSVEEIIGKTDHELPWYEVAEKIWAIEEEIIKTGIPREFEESGKLASGEVVTFLVRKSPLYDTDNKIIGVIGTAIEITERKVIEAKLKEARENAEAAKIKEEQLRRAVMILAGSIAHDLRTPLACVNVYIKMLCSELANNIPPKAQEILDRLSVISREMNQSIDMSLRSLTQSVIGIKSTDNLTVCHIWSCTEETLTHYPFNEGERELVHWYNKNSFSFLGNPIFFYRILFNLLKNSLYQIEQKTKGEIYIESDESDDSNLLCFKDTAGGVTENMLRDIFAGFNTTKAEGTGIGLAFCQLAMRNIGGDLSCHIVDNDCIEFVLSFPKL